MKVPEARIPLLIHTLFPVLILTLLITGCSTNDRNPVGPQLPDEGWFGEGPFLDTLYTVDELTARIQEGAGASPFLVVGADAELVSRALIRFLFLPEADSILTARLDFRGHALIGTDALTLEVYLLDNAEWVESETTWALVSGTETEDPVGWTTPGGDLETGSPSRKGEVTASVFDSTFSIALDPNAVRLWSYSIH